MEFRKTFLISLLISFLLNLAVFGFLILFRPVRPEKSSVVSISFETASPQKPLKTGKSRKKIGSRKSLDGKNKVCSEKRVVVRKRAVKRMRNVRLHRQNKRKIESKRVSRKIVSQGVARNTKRLKQQKVLKAEERDQNRPIAGKSFSGKTAKSLKSESFYKSEKALKREGGSSPPLHREETAVGKAGNMVSGSPISGGVAGAPQKPKESKGKKAAGKDRENYLKLVLREVEKNKFYPLIARRMGIEGRVRLKIVIGKGGELLSVSVLSSDSEILKKAAVKTLKKCHFPPPPGGKFETDLTIHYRLN